MLYRGDDPIQDRSTKNRPVFGLGSSFVEPQVRTILPEGVDVSMDSPSPRSERLVFESSRKLSTNPF
jgi:hypothetical protein